MNLPSGHFRAENRMDDKNTRRRNTNIVDFDQPLLFVREFKLLLLLSFFKRLTTYRLVPLARFRDKARLDDYLRLSPTLLFPRENNYYSFACSTLMTLCFLRAPRTKGGERSFPTTKFTAQENRLNNAPLFPQLAFLSR